MDVTTVISAEGHTFEPWTDGHALGFKVTHAQTGRVQHVYLNPSGGDDEGACTVFLYTGDGDPTKDSPTTHVEITPKVRAVSIWLNRAEGPRAECGEVTSEGPDVWAWADAQLATWSRTAPDRGFGYDKCDFKVTYADGSTYDGRYDIERGVRPDLAAHMKDHFAHVLANPRVHEPYINLDHARTFLATYEIGD